MLLSEDANKLPVFLHRLKDKAGRSRMCLEPSNCKILLHDLSGSKPNLVLAGQHLDVMNKLGSLMSHGN